MSREILGEANFLVSNYTFQQNEFLSENYSAARFVG